MTKIELKLTEEEIRRETICRGCGKEKEEGLIVCWHCFKHRKDIIPYKYFEDDFDKWLKMVKKAGEVKNGNN